MKSFIQLQRRFIIDESYSFSVALTKLSNIFAIQSNNLFHEDMLIRLQQLEEAKSGVPL